MLHRQAVKRPRRRLAPVAAGFVRWVAAGCLKIGLIIAVFVLVGAGFVLLYQSLARSALFRLEQVEVRGVDDAVKEELIAAGGLNSEVSLLALNLGELKHQMEQHPLVRRVSLRRRFPHTLVVEAERERPVALLLSDRLYYVNSWGEVYKPVEDPERPDLPIVTGVIGDGVPSARRLVPAVTLLQALKREADLWARNRLSEIHVEGDGTVSLYFDHLAAAIRMSLGRSQGKESAGGRTDSGRKDGRDLRQRFHRLERVVRHLAQSGRADRVRMIDLSNGEEAVVSFGSG